MPYVNIKVIEGVFSQSEKQQMIESVTDALVSIEGEAVRDETLVIVDETKSGDWGIGGRCVSTEEIKALRSKHDAAV